MSKILEIKKNAIYYRIISLFFYYIYLQYSNNKVMYLNLCENTVMKLLIIKY